MWGRSGHPVKAEHEGFWRGPVKENLRQLETETSLMLDKSWTTQQVKFPTWFKKHLNLNTSD